MNRRDDSSFLEREAEAGTFLTKAMELMPQHADSYRLLSGLRVDEMRWEEAAVLARRAAPLPLPLRALWHDACAFGCGHPAYPGNGVDSLKASLSYQARRGTQACRRRLAQRAGRRARRPRRQQRLARPRLGRACGGGDAPLPSWAAA